MNLYCAVILKSTNQQCFSHTVTDPEPDQPTLLVSPITAFVQSGTQLAFRCQTSHTEDRTYKFYKGGQLIDRQLQDNNYVIDSASTINTGRYTCAVIINGVESVQSNGHTVTVIG